MRGYSSIPVIAAASCLCSWACESGGGPGAVDVPSDTIDAITDHGGYDLGLSWDVVFDVPVQGDEGVDQQIELPPHPAPGKVIVTEFMARSQGGTDKGEWIELLNLDGDTAHLQGCVLGDDDGEEFTFASPFDIPAGGYAVLARSANVAENHGVDPDFVYKGFNLANTDDEIVLSCSGYEVDRVEYDKAWVEEGVAVQLSPDHLDPGDNDVMENWCLAASEFGTQGMKGTPGAANEACPDVCEPNPCTSPPEDQCLEDGATLVKFLGEAECKNVGWKAQCNDYPSEQVDCSADGKICYGGECIPDPCTPNPCTEPPEPVCMEDGVTLNTFGSTATCSVEDGLAVCGAYPLVQIDCSAAGNQVCSEGACVPPPPPNPAAAGDLVVTEFMARSQGGTDKGEWVEVYNTTGKPLNLGGCVLGDDGSDHHEIAGIVVIEAGAYALLARGIDGYTPDYVYSGFVLSNTDDEIVLTCGDVEVDRVVYDASWVQTGVAIQLAPGSFDWQANDDKGNWCPAVDSYGDSGKLGTPGAPNHPCL